ncbi:MAG: (Fe-S)-binding protein, partial [Chloroflexota bacterium]|nr:(Fe-S)-binding protein [Chloroflexota bacterium]
MNELPGRPEFWNIGYPLLGTLVYLMLLAAAGSIAVGLGRRYRLWRLGRPSTDVALLRSRPRLWLRLLANEVLGHRRFINRDWYGGLMHLFLFWGIIVLLFATTLSALEFNWHTYVAPWAGFEFPTSYVRVQTKFVWDVFGGLMASVGVAMAIWRRYVIRPPRLNTFLDDGVTLFFIAALLLTGFLLEGLRIAATQLNPASELYAPSMAWVAPVGYGFALLYRAAGVTPYATEVAHFTLWWTHVSLLAAAFAYAALRFSKLSHILISPLNVLIRSDRPQGALRYVPDLETAERFGAGDITDLTRKQLLELDACTNCGRCQDQCPAHMTGKALSPRKLIQDLRGYMETRGAQLLAARGAPAPAAPVTMTTTVTEEALWDCTTCRACIKACPVHIQHIDTIVDMRRHLTMEQARLPEAAQQAL